MNEQTMKHLKVGDKIVRINTDYDYFGDESTMDEEWFTIEEINARRTVYFCRDWQNRMVLFDDKQILNFSATSECAYEKAIKELKDKAMILSRKTAFCERMLKVYEKRRKENEDEEA